MNDKLYVRSSRKNTNHNSYSKSGSSRKRINFALVIHNHQPVGNDPAILEEIYRKAYHPLLKKLSEVPTVRANIHYSGYLLEWIEQHHPEFIALLREMVRRDQVEMVGGGYYEPILVCIPDRDAVGQVALLSEKIGSLFGRRPRGLWTAERAWEPQMPEVIQQCGLSYTALDDTIFNRSGITERGCLRHYIVESRGSTVTVFPILKRLRYLMPWKSANHAIAFLRENADQEDEEEDGQRIAVFGDDGEKFGAWPTTFRLVYEKGWLENFLELLVRNQDWLRTVRLSDYLSEQKPHDRVYLPSGSYDEMMEWSIPRSFELDEKTRRKTSGFWRNFLSKYPESGRMYAKMLSVSEMAQRVERGNRIAILRELWKGQANDAYWHGVFGGLYSSSLRRVTYGHLIQAQRMAESIFHSRAEEEEEWLVSSDEVFNGYIEHTINTRSLCLRICPDVGGSLAELDFKDAATNILDTLPRRREAYHDEVRKAGHERSAGKGTARSIHEAMASKEAGLVDLLAYDRYPKFSFLDFLVEDKTEIGDFVNQTYREVAGLAGRPYSFKNLERDESGARLTLSRATGGESHDRGGLKLEKVLDIPASGAAFVFRYRIGIVGAPLGGRRKAEEKISGRLAIELNFGSLGDSAFIKTHAKAAAKSRAVAREIVYPEVGVKVSLEFSRAVDLWFVPIRTVSRSESGFESNLQGVSVIPNFLLEKDPDGDALDIRLSLQKL